MSTTSQERATMPSGTQQVLERRSLERGNAHVIPLLSPGMRVLDVGCGSGSITLGMAEQVGNTGMVLGIDRNTELITTAKTRSSPNLSFEVADLFAYEPEGPFDMITASRVLQWLDNPSAALTRMSAWLKPGGYISILDYNHEKIQWDPQPPRSFRSFYDLFFAWRADAGMNNHLADDLSGLLKSAGLENVEVTSAAEYTARGDADFLETAGIWSRVIETRGGQMVGDNFLTERARLNALQAFGDWLHEAAMSMRLYLLNVTGQKTDHE